MKPQKKHIPFVSLFSGAMGLDLGLEANGFEAAICVENDPEAVATINLNRPNLPVLGDIRTVDGITIRELSKIKGEVPLVAGGPPCQAFSVFGNRRGVEDTRGALLLEFVRIVEELQPHVFVMENVRGLLSMPVVPANSESLQQASSEDTKHGALLNKILNKFSEIGYRVDCFVVNAVNYGAPQIRERVICIGNRHGLQADFPEPLYSNRLQDDLPPFRTLADAIGEGFVDPMPEVMNFSARKLKYLAMVPPGGNWRSLPIEIQQESMGKSWYLKGGRSAYWRKLSFAFPSPTVVTMPNHAGTSMCHPTELRAISVGEAAAIQEFPCNWRFAGSTTAKFKQVGNAVPTRLGKVTGEVISSLLDQIECGKSVDDVPENRIVHVRPHVRTRTFWKDGQVFSGDKSYYEEDVDVSGHNAHSSQLSINFL